MSSLKLISIEDIQQARKTIESTVLRTRLRLAPKALQHTRSEVYLKHENEQITGSFKIRGAMNKMTSLTADERRRGVVASSAGNHAQGVAFGAKALGVPAHIVMPVTAPMVKINATKSYGAQVILHGEMYDEAYAHACELAKEKGYIFVHPYLDPLIIAGQGTIGLEIFEDLPAVDTVVVPIGGGGLISGIACALKTLKPDVRVIGVVSSQAPAMRQLYYGETPSTITKKRVSTIADGIAVKTPNVDILQTYLKKYVDQIVEVSDDEIAQAIVLLLEKGKTVTEGSGAAGVAAVLSKNLELGAKTCVVLGGGNIDLNIMAKVIERGLRLEHRLARIAVVVDDIPGNLNRLTSIFAEMRANVLEVYHDRVSPDLNLRETRIDFLIETSSDEHIDEILKVLKQQVSCRIVSSPRSN